MPKYGQLVLGPAGSGKTTYCSVIKEHFEAQSRVCHVVNLDPAAENELRYDAAVDVRELLTARDVSDQLTLGPNGALVACMEYLVEEGLDWLEDRLNGFGEDDYILFDLPGQIELYSHIPVIKQLVHFLKRQDFRICAVYCIDCMFVTDSAKFIAGSLAALSAMVALELPHVNVLTKCDLLKSKNEDGALAVRAFLEMDIDELKAKLAEGMDVKYRKLNEALAGLLEEYSLVQFAELDITEEESIDALLGQVNNTINYGEDIEPRESDYLGDSKADNCDFQD